MSQPSAANCAACPAHHAGNLVKLGVDMSDCDYVVALAGNPNTGKSTVFNALTGLRQHTGNWPGKTVARAEGGFSHRRPALQAGRPAGHLLAALRQPRRGDRARLHPLRQARRDRDRGRRHAPRAQPQPGAAGARDHRPRGGLPEPDGRGAAQGPRRSTSAGWRATSACRWSPPSARYGEGLDELNRAISEVATGQHGVQAAPRRRPPAGARAGGRERWPTRSWSVYPDLPNAALGRAAPARRRPPDRARRCATATWASCSENEAGLEPVAAAPEAGVAASAAEVVAPDPPAALAGRHGLPPDADGGDLRRGRAAWPTAP